MDVDETNDIVVGLLALEKQGCRTRAAIDLILRQSSEVSLAFGAGWDMRVDAINGEAGRPYDVDAAFKIWRERVSEGHESPEDREARYAAMERRHEKELLNE